MLIRIHQHAAALTRQRIADVEHHSIRAHHRKTRPIAVSDRARRRDEDAVEHASDNARIVRRDTDSRREPHIDGKLRGVFASNQQTALFNEGLQMRQSVVAQSLTRICGGIEQTQVRSDLALLPGKSIAPLRQPIDDLLR